jgi:hypothetical protein
MDAHLRMGINRVHVYLLSDDPVSAYENTAGLLRWARRSIDTEADVLQQLQMLMAELATCWCRGMDSGRKHLFCQAIACWPIFRSRLN